MGLWLDSKVTTQNTEPQRVKATPDELRDAEGYHTDVARAMQKALEAWEVCSLGSDSSDDFTLLLPNLLLVDVSDIFYFFGSGEGKGESEAPGGRQQVGFLFMKLPGGGGGCSQDVGRGAGRVSGGNLGGGGA